MSLFSTENPETENNPVDTATAIAMNNAAQWEYYTAAAKYTRSKHMALGVLLLLMLYAIYKSFNS
jgi:hypothetical protein